MKQILIFIFLFACILSQAQSTKAPIKIEPLDSPFVHYVTYDTLFSPDSITYVATITKAKMTRAEAINRLYVLTDNQKRVLEAQAQAQENFLSMDSLLKKETNLNYIDILEKIVLKEIEGVYLFQYETVQQDATIAAGKLKILDKTYNIRVNDRGTIVIVSLMGTGNNVRLTRRGNDLQGEYQKKNVFFIRKQ